MYPSRQWYSPGTASPASSSLHTCACLSVCNQEFEVRPAYDRRTPHSVVGSRERGGICSSGNPKLLTAQGSPAPPGEPGRDGQRAWTESDSRQHPRPPHPSLQKLGTPAAAAEPAAASGGRGRGRSGGRAHARRRAPAVGHVARGQGSRRRKCPEAQGGRGSPPAVARRRPGAVSGAARAEGPSRAGHRSRSRHGPAPSAPALCGRLGCWVRAGAGRAPREALQDPRPSPPRTPTRRTPPPRCPGRPKRGGTDARARALPSLLLAPWPALWPGPSRVSGERRWARRKRTCGLPGLGPGRARETNSPFSWSLAAPPLFLSVDTIGTVWMGWYFRWSQRGVSLGF